MKIFIDLVLDTGELVRIEAPQKFENEVWELIEDTMKRRDWLSARVFDGMQFTFLGHSIARVNMGRVVATL